MQDFKKLQVWQKSHRLALDVYAETANFPRAEMFGLTSQLRRASVSIAANIAEGSSTGSDKEFARFLRVSRASASEIEYYAILVLALGLVDKPTADKWTEDVCEVRRMIVGLLASFPKRRPKKQAQPSE